jgi:hypothetical protein
MGTTSYDKIYHMMTKTTGFKALIADVLTKMENLEITNVTHHLNIKDTAYTNATFSTNLGSTHGEGRYLQPSDVLEHDSVRTVLEAHFGVDVKTYNCSRDTVFDGGYLNHSNRHQNSFYYYAYNWLSDNHSDALERGSHRLKTKIAEKMASEEFKADAHACLVRRCKETIVKAMMPWREMDDSVLKDAWSEFLCNSIIEQ